MFATNWNVRKNPWTINDVVKNSHAFEIIGIFAKRFNAMLKQKVRDTPFDDSTFSYTTYVEVVSMGTFTIQSDWHDKVGYFITLSPHSLYKHHAWVQEAQKEAFAIFSSLIPATPKQDREEQLMLHEDGSATLFIKTDLISAGD